MTANDKDVTTDTGGLHRHLSSVGALLLTLSCLSPVLSIYGVGSDVLQSAGSGAVLLFLLGIAAAVVWALVYAELGSAYPYAGGDYVGVGTILGPWAGAATLAIWAVTAGPSSAFLAKFTATYVIELAPALPAEAVTFGALAAAVLISLLAVRTGALVTGVFLAIEVVAVLVLIGVGFAHPARGVASALAHPVMMGPSGALTAVPVGVLALGALSAVYGTVGGNQAVSFGEELIDPHKRMGRVIAIACLFGAVSIGVAMVAVVVGTPDLAAMLKSPAPVAAFATQTLGPAAGKALSASVALAIFNALIATMMYSARLFFSIGRDGLLPGRLGEPLARVHGPSGAPRIATLVLGVYVALCCLLSTHVLLVFLTALLVYGWGLVCLAVLVGRRKGMTGGPGYWRAPLYPLAPVIGLGMAVVFAIADLADKDAGRPSLILMGLVVTAAILWNRFGLQRRPGGWRPTLPGQATPL